MSIIKSAISLRLVPPSVALRSVRCVTVTYVNKLPGHNHGTYGVLDTVGTPRFLLFL